MAYAFMLIIATLLMIPGIIMAATPFPGLFYMFVIALLAAMLDHFQHISAHDIGVLAIIAIVTLVIDALSGLIGSKIGGAHWSSVFWGLVGFLLGAFLIPIPLFGNVAGMFIGVLASELFRTRDIRRAKKAALGSFWGWATGTGFKLIASVVFIVLFVIFGVV